MLSLILSTQGNKKCSIEVVCLSLTGYPASFDMSALSVVFLCGELAVACYIVQVFLLGASVPRVVFTNRQ